MAVENDIVLIYIEHHPRIFARIEKIVPDSKKDWYHVTLLLLQVPLETVTWILKDLYIDGDEFTMNGRPMRLEKVVASRLASVSTQGTAVEDSPAAQTKARVLSFEEAKNKKK